MLMNVETRNMGIMGECMQYKDGWDAKMRTSQGPLFPLITSSS